MNDMMIRSTGCRAERPASGPSDARSDAGRGGVRRGTGGLVAKLRADGARPARFALVGGLCGAVQLGLLALFLRGEAPAIPANLLAFLVSAQLNFVLSDRFTWGDRRNGGGPARGFGRRWLAFHGSIAGTALLNQCVFLAAHLTLPDVAASALGIGVAAVANFLLQDRLVFHGLRG